MDFLVSNGGGNSLFDPYSLYHFVFFIAISLVLYPIFKKNVWVAILALTFVWEVFEKWVVIHFPSFPYVGTESFVNKCIGDPISNILGYLLAIFIIKIIRKDAYEKFKKACMEKK